MALRITQRQPRGQKLSTQPKAPNSASYTPKTQLDKWVAGIAIKYDFVRPGYAADLY